MMIATWHYPVSGCDPGYLWILGYSWVHRPSSPGWAHGCSTHCLGDSPPFSFPSFFFPPLSSHPSLPEPSLSPCRSLRNVFVPSLCCPASVVSLLCFYYFLPVLLCSAPHLPPLFFLCSACLLCAPLACCPPLFVFPLVSPLFCCGWLPLLTFLLPPFLCVCQRTFGRLHCTCARFPCNS